MTILERIRIVMGIGSIAGMDDDMDDDTGEYSPEELSALSAIAWNGPDATPDEDIRRMIERCRRG